MTTANHLEALKRRHHSLDARIQGAEAAPSSNDLEIKEMKKEKLLLKDQIARMEQA